MNRRVQMERDEQRSIIKIAKAEGKNAKTRAHVSRCACYCMYPQLFESVCISQESQALCTLDLRVRV